MFATLIDSYSESNKNNSTFVRTGITTAFFGQSFAVGTSSLTLNNCVLYMAKFGSPTGSAYVKIYAHSGTYGTSSVPTGTALATSDAFDTSTLTSSFVNYTFTFSGANSIVLNASTNYALALDGSAVGSSGNQIQLGIDTTQTHAGNAFQSSDGSSWITQASTDCCFYIYGDPIIRYGGFFLH